MSPKKRASPSLNALFKSEVREAVEEQLDVDQGNFVQPSSTESSEDEVIRGIFSSFPSSEGYYGKVYKVLSDGKFEIKDYTIEAPELIRDLELEVKDIVLAKDWGEGTYYVQIRNNSQRGLFGNRKIVVGIPTQIEREERQKKGKVIPFIHHQDPTDQASKIIDKSMSIARTMVSPAPSAQLDVPRLMEAQTNAQKAGFDMGLQAGKSQTSPPDNSSNIALQIITILKETGLFKQPEKIDEISILSKLKELGIVGEKRDEGEMIDKIINRLQALGVIGGQKEDSLASLVRLKETMGMKFPWEHKSEDAMDTIGKVANIVQAVKPLVNPDAAPASTIQIIFEAISKFGEPLFNTLRDIAESKKLEMQYRLESTGRPIPPSVRRQATRQEIVEHPSVPNSQPNSEPVLPPGDTTMISPILNKIAEIISKQDTTQFDWLRQTIIYKLGPFGQNYLENLATGQLTIDYLMSSLLTEYESVLKTLGFYNLATSQNTKAYFEKFVLWLKTQYGTQDVPEGGIQAKCGKCGEVYTFDTQQDWQSDVKTCDVPDCYGQLQLTQQIIA